MPRPAPSCASSGISSTSPRPSAGIRQATTPPWSGVRSPA
uniref:Uncharacterized protein n=1 Tax=Zea mays TaxID=4577 RepID=C4J8N3_MAIZE|nr:unknown [Zea mays]